MYENKHICICCSPVSKQIPIIHPFTFDGFRYVLLLNFLYNFIFQLVQWDLFVACHITKHISILVYFLVYRLCSM